jgi:hypothetical protein
VLANCFSALGDVAPEDGNADQLSPLLMGRQTIRVWTAFKLLKNPPRSYYASSLYKSIVTTMIAQQKGCGTSSISQSTCHGSRCGRTDTAVLVRRHRQIYQQNQLLPSRLREHNHS